MPPGGLNIRWPDPPLDQELRLHRYKLAAAVAFARANRLDRIVIDAPAPRFGIVTTGKSYLDVRQALDELGIGDAEAAAIGPAPLQGGDAVAARTGGRAPFRRGPCRKSWSSRRSARSSKPSSRSSFTTGRPTGGRASSASSTRPASGSCRRTANCRRRRSPASSAVRLAGLGGASMARRAPRPARGARAPGGRQRRAVPAHAVFLLGLPAQHLDQGAGRQPRAGRHRLPLPVAIHGPRDRDLHPDGRRGRAVDRPGAVHRDAPRLRQYRRRHLHPFGHPGDPRGGRGQGQHDLQGAVQRRRGDDRRPAARRRSDRAAGDPAARGRRRAADRRRHRRAREISARHRIPAMAPRCATATTSTRCSASCAN